MDLVDLLLKTIMIICFSISGLGFLIRVLNSVFNKKTRPEVKSGWVKLVPYTRLVRETIHYTNNVLATKEIKQFPRFRIRYYKHSRYAGLFDGEVVVYLKKDKDIAELVNTVLHEVMHYVQSKTDKQYKSYEEFTGTYGYWNNPFETEAREFAARYCESCLKHLESKHIIKRI